MTKSKLQQSAKSKASRSIETSLTNQIPRKRTRRKKENTDVLVSAVISTYLLTHLHHVLQRAEFGASKEGKVSQAANFAQLRKVLCMDARSMKDASAEGMRDMEMEKAFDQKIEANAA